MKPGSSEVTVTLCHTDQLIIDCQNQYTLRARSGAQATTVCHLPQPGHLRPVSCLCTANKFAKWPARPGRRPSRRLSLTHCLTYLFKVRLDLLLTYSASL